MSEQTFALVTGANKGIGFATARELGSRGVTVFLGARDRKRGQEATSTLTAEGLDARLVMLDITQQETIDAASEQVERADRQHRVSVQSRELELQVNEL